jgi:hypothetical protein
MKHNKSQSIDSPSSDEKTSSPFKGNTSTIFHSEDDILVYEDFIRRSRQLVKTPLNEQSRNAEETESIVAIPSKSNEQTNQQSKMNNNQLQQTVNFEPESIESGIKSSHDDNEVLNRQEEMSKSNTPMIDGLSAMNGNATPLSLREQMILFLDDPKSSRSAMYFSLFIAFLVIASTTAIVIESLPTFYHNHSIIWWYYGEVVVMTIFTIEFIARCYAHSISWNKFIAFMTGTIFVLLLLLL